MATLAVEDGLRGLDNQGVGVCWDLPGSPFACWVQNQEGDQDVKLGMELVAIMTKSRIYQGENVREFLESDERLENTSFIFKDPDDDDVKLTEASAFSFQKRLQTAALLARRTERGSSALLPWDKLDLAQAHVEDEIWTTYSVNEGLPLAVFRGKNDELEDYIPVYVIFGEARSEIQLSSATMGLGPCSWAPGNICMAFSRLASTIPLKPFLEFLVPDQDRTGKPYKLIFSGFGIGGAVAALFSLRLIDYAISSQVHQDNVLSVHVIAIGSPLIGDSEFCAYASNLASKTRSMFSWITCEQSKIPQLLNIIIVLASQMDSLHTGNYLDSEDNTKATANIYTMFKTFEDAVFHIVLEAWKEPQSEDEVEGKPKRTKDPDSFKNLDKVGLYFQDLFSASLDIPDSLDSFGTWLSTDEFTGKATAKSALSETQQLSGILHGKAAWLCELNAQDLRTAHQYANTFVYRNISAVPELDLLHPSRIQTPLTSSVNGNEELQTLAYWGTPELDGNANLLTSVVRNDGHGMLLKLVVHGRRVSLVSSVRVKLGDEMSAPTNVDPSSTDNYLRVTVSFNKKSTSQLELGNTELNVELQSMFVAMTWSSFPVVLPEEVQEIERISLREKRVAGLELGQVLNEALLCCISGTPQTKTMGAGKDFLRLGNWQLKFSNEELFLIHQNGTCINLLTGIAVKGSQRLDEEYETLTFDKITTLIPTGPGFLQLGEHWRCGHSYLLNAFIFANKQGSQVLQLPVDQKKRTKKDNGEGVFICTQNDKSETTSIDWIWNKELLKETDFVSGVAVGNGYIEIGDWRLGEGNDDLFVFSHKSRTCTVSFSKDGSVLETEPNQLASQRKYQKLISPITLWGNANNPLLKRLRSLEVQDDHEVVRWTNAAKKQFKHTVAAVTDDNGALLPGIEGLLTFAVSAEQLKELSATPGQSAGPLVQRDSSCSPQAPERSGSTQSETVSTVLDVHMNNSKQYVPLSFSEAAYRHDLPMKCRAAEWALSPLQPAMTPADAVEHNNQYQHQYYGRQREENYDETTSQDARITSELVEPLALKPTQSNLLENLTFSRRGDCVTLQDDDMHPFGRHFLPGMHVEADLIAGTAVVTATAKETSTIDPMQTAPVKDCYVLTKPQFEMVHVEASSLGFCCYTGTYSGRVLDLATQAAGKWNSNLVLHQNGVTKWANVAMVFLSLAVTAINSHYKGVEIIVRDTGELWYNYVSAREHMSENSEKFTLDVESLTKRFHDVLSKSNLKHTSKKKKPEADTAYTYIIHLNEDINPSHLPVLTDNDQMKHSGGMAVELWENQRKLFGYRSRCALPGDPHPHEIVYLKEDGTLHVQAVLKKASDENAKKQSKAKDGTVMDKGISDRDIEPPPGYQWQDDNWILDRGGLSIKLRGLQDKKGRCLMQTRDSEHRQRNAIVNTGALEACDNNGWQYSFDFLNKISGKPYPWDATGAWNHHVRRRRWLRRCIKTSSQDNNDSDCVSLSSTNDTSVVAGAKQEEANSASRMASTDSIDIPSDEENLSDVDLSEEEFFDMSEPLLLEGFKEKPKRKILPKLRARVHSFSEMRKRTIGRHKKRQDTTQPHEDVSRLYVLLRNGYSVMNQPLSSDVQLATWQSLRKIMLRFAYASLPDPSTWKKVAIVAGGVAAGALLLVPAAGAVAAGVTGGLLGLAYATAGIVALSGIGRFVLGQLEKEKKLYERNLIMACALVGIPAAQHGDFIYSMEKALYNRVREIVGQSANPCADLMSLAQEGSTVWESRVCSFTSIDTVSSKARLLERQCIASFLADVYTVYELRQLLLKRYKVGLVGPMKSGKSTFLRALGCNSDASANYHTNDITSHWFCAPPQQFPGESPHHPEDNDMLGLIDFPGHNDSELKIGKMFFKHYGILDAALIVVDILNMDSSELHLVLKVALLANRPVLLCLNKADRALMKSNNVCNDEDDEQDLRPDGGERYFQQTREAKTEDELWMEAEEKLRTVLIDDNTTQDIVFVRSKTQGFRQCATEPYLNLSVALTVFELENTALEEDLAKCNVLSAVDVFDSWVLPLMKKHAPRFDCDYVRQSIWGNDE
eukprot:m.54823 g.54823  ORF g.54823 m.54823 type:complete len:2065 (+) comp10953_c0_seq3:145-6339(+)